MQSPNGLLLIDKPAGITSFGVVARVRGQLSRQVGKKVKVGHTGTLDPFATGLMIIVVGDYCKRAGEFTKLDKTYEATIHLGVTSSTGDPEGELTSVSDRHSTLAEIQAVLPQFTGVIQQTPPAYSAIKIDGQRAYKLAREGKKVAVPPRTVTIYSLEITDYLYPNLNIRCKVSSGTYIRTLAEDIGKVLGTGAYTSQLRRTSIDVWKIEDAQSVEGVQVSDVQLAA